MPAFKQFSKIQVATAIAVIFHIVGLTGIFLFESAAVIRATPLNLLLCFALLIWTQGEKNIFFWVFVTAVIAAGFVSEVIGVHTGWLFGNYSYGNVLGYKWLQVPVIIGINWFIIIYCCGISIQTLLQRILKPVNRTAAEFPTKLKAVSIVTDSATLAVIFDWLMEPVAVKLNFWQWKAGNIPSYNYASWFIISVLLLILFRWCRFSKQNKFAVNLLLIQSMFFLLLRTFYHTN